MTRSSDVSRKAELTRLGLAGLVPFIAAALFVWIGPLLPEGDRFARTMHSMVLSYGSVIVAYLAGVGAGGLLNQERQKNEPLLPGMITVLVAWIAVWGNLPFRLNIPGAWCHGLILLALIYLLLRDLRAVEAGILPSWYGSLRIRLTFWAGLSITAVILKLVQWGYY